MIGAANGTAVGFAVGPAAEKGAVTLSGLFAGRHSISSAVPFSWWSQSRHEN